MDEMADFKANHWNQWRIYSCGSPHPGGAASVYRILMGQVFDIKQPLRETRLLIG